MNSEINNKQRAQDARILDEVTGEAVESIKHDDMLANLLSRRTLLQTLSGGTLALMAGLAMGETPAQAQTVAGGSAARDVDILNFALNDEYLESEFYSYATSGKGIETFGVGITGQNGLNGTTVAPGTTTGGGLVNFTDNTIKTIALQLADDERKHVNFVRQTITSLGGTPIARPNLNLAALATKYSLDPAAQSTFLIGGRSFCDVGVSAYAGASKFLFTPAVIQGAARILAVEAYHAGNLRLLIAQNNIPAPALDAEDVPPPTVNPNYFPVDTNALAVIRTVLQVLGVFYLTPDAVTAGANNTTTVPAAGGFFPNGVNGNLPSLLSLVG